MIGEIFSEYLPTILITLLAGFIFFIASLYFVRYKEKSGEYERYKKAKETVIDVLESSLINKQSVSPERVKHIISAAEREQNTELKDSPKSIIEDLELRFEKSKHLDTEQQIHYINQVEEMISKFESESKISSVPLSYEEILTSLKENIEEGKKDDALIGLDTIANKISGSYRHTESSPKYMLYRLTRTKAIKVFIILYLLFIIIFSVFTIFNVLTSL